MYYAGKLLRWRACGWRIRRCLEASVDLRLKEGSSGTESRCPRLRNAIKLFTKLVGREGVEMGFEGSGPGDCVGLIGEVELEGLETVVGVDVVDGVTTFFGL